MTDAEVITTNVVNDVTLAALVDGRIHPLVLPDSPTLPAVTYGLVSQPTAGTQDGVEYRAPRWRFTIWSRRYADLVPIAEGLAGIFGSPVRTPFPSSRIEYPASHAEGHEADTHLFWRRLDVVVGLAPAGSSSQ